MLPDGVLSTEVVQDIFSGARALPVTKINDYEDGGIGLNDSSEGMLYQVWHCYLVDIGSNVVNVMLESLNTPAFVLYSDTLITEISITFDQNMRPILAFVKEGLAYLRWYDSSLGYQVITSLASDVVNPRVTLDDKRPLQIAISDIILAYSRAGNLYYRQQRDRYEVEYLLQTGISGLIKIGMNKQLRLQFLTGIL